MARFKADIQGARGAASRLGTPASEIRGHIRGWQSGVSVDGAVCNDEDHFDVRATGGSSGAHLPLLLATVTNLPGGKREIVLYHPRTGRVVARHID